MQCSKAAMDKLQEIYKHLEIKYVPFYMHFYRGRKSVYFTEFSV